MLVHVNVLSAKMSFFQISWRNFVRSQMETFAKKVANIAKKQECSKYNINRLAALCCPIASSIAVAQDSL